MTADVLKEAERRLTLGHDAGHIRPQMPGVICPVSLPRHAKRLARIPSMDEIHRATKSPCVELSEITEDGSAVKESIRHPSQEDVLAERLDLNIRHGTVVWDDGFEPKVQSSNPATE